MKQYFGVVFAGNTVVTYSSFDSEQEAKDWVARTVPNYQGQYVNYAGAGGGLYGGYQQSKATGGAVYELKASAEVPPAVLVWSGNK